MNELKCENCKYFLQHYVMRNNKLSYVYCGHCTFDRVKRRYPDRPACEHFIRGELDKERFATKEFLSKELFKYILDLDLLPNIEEYILETKKTPKKKARKNGDISIL